MLIGCGAGGSFLKNCDFSRQALFCCVTGTLKKVVLILKVGSECGRLSDGVNKCCLNATQHVECEGYDRAPSGVASGRRGSQTRSAAAQRPPPRRGRRSFGAGLASRGPRGPRGAETWAPGGPFRRKAIWPFTRARVALGLTGHGLAATAWTPEGRAGRGAPGSRRSRAWRQPLPGAPSERRRVRPGSLPVPALTWRPARRRKAKLPFRTWRWRRSGLRAGAAQGAPVGGAGSRPLRGRGAG